LAGLKHDKNINITELAAFATSLKVEGLRPDEVNIFFSIYLNLPATLGPGVYSASHRNENQKQ
jgi:hypothetical protein